MTSDQPISMTRQRLILGLIVLLFVGPILVAWLLTSGSVDWRSRGLVNQGQLLSPPFDLTPYGAQPGFAPLFKLHPSEWAIVYLEPTVCGDRCAKALDELLVIRELLGQGGVRATVHAIASGGVDAPRHAGRVHTDQAAIALLRTRMSTSAAHNRIPAIVLVDWRHQIMMRYAPRGESRAIQKDLKRLLRASAIR